MSAGSSCGSVDVFEDPVALLQQEIARLEEELRLREEAGAAPGLAGAERDAQEARIAGLVAELSERDEMIQLLLDQTRFLEETLAADRAERDELTRWLDQMEMGLERGEGAASPLPVSQAEPARASDEERRGWESARRDMQAEIDRLRSELDAARRIDTAARRSDQGSLRAENLRLTETCRELTAAATASASEIESLQVRLANRHAELESLRAELAEACAERESARKRFTPTRSASPDPEPTAGEPGPDLSPNERIRALREHLREIQQREEEERRNRSLSVRLAHLFRRSNPGH